MSSAEREARTTRSSDGPASARTRCSSSTASSRSPARASAMPRNSAPLAFDSPSDLQWPTTASST
ncbi:MAG: hypothetical protein H6713_37375 [Myxococcales bacterium]|nr:hypothetical protein [Myxococcales bacterium]